MLDSVGRRRELPGVHRPERRAAPVVGRQVAVDPQVHEAPLPRVRERVAPVTRQRYLVHVDLAASNKNVAPQVVGADALSQPRTRVPDLW